MSDVADEQFVVERQQRQWDAFFRAIVPGARMLHQMIEAKLPLPGGSLTPLVSLPTDLPSATVGKALHWDKPFKELRGDGMYLSTAKFVVSCEYQSTHNPGMRLRFAMYQEALLEHVPKHVERSWCHILVYSGHERTKQYAADHLKISKGYLGYVVVDLNSIDRDELGRGSIEDAIIALSHREAVDIAPYRQVLRRIRNERSSDARRSTKLRAALMVASLNKDGLAKRLYREIGVDENLRRGLRSFLPLFHASELEEERRERIHEWKKRIEEKRDHLLDLVELQHGPEELLDLIRDADAEWLEENAPEVRRAVREGELDTFVATFRI